MYTGRCTPAYQVLPLLFSQSQFIIWLIWDINTYPPWWPWDLSSISALYILNMLHRLLLIQFSLSPSYCQYLYYRSIMIFLDAHCIWVLPTANVNRERRLHRVSDFPTRGTHSEKWLWCSEKMILMFFGPAADAILNDSDSSCHQAPLSWPESNPSAGSSHWSNMILQY